MNRKIIKKRMKKGLKWILIIFALICLTVIILLNTPSFQRYIAQKLTEIVNENSRATFSVGKLELSFPLRFNLQDVMVKDHKDKTILQAQEIQVSVSDINPVSQLIRLRDIKINGVIFNLIHYKGDEDLNVMYLLPESGEEETSGGDWEVELTNIDIINSKFVYEDRDYPELLQPNQVDYFYLGIGDLNAKVSSFRLDENQDMFINLKTLSAKDKSGFEIKDLSTNLKIGPKNWLADFFRIKTPTSDVAFELRFDCNGYGDFSDFIQKVNMKAFFDRSEVSIQDLSYFAPELQDIRNTILLDGSFDGTVDDFKTEDVLIYFADDTEISGDFQIKGLPDWRNMYVDADIKKLYTSKKDVQKISYQHHSLELPEYMKNFEYLDVKGKVKGTLHDFTSKLEVETNLGMVNGDVAVNDTINGTLSYGGEIQGRNIDIGTIFNQKKDFNKIDIDALLEGKGTDLATMSASLDAVVNNFDYKGEKYQGITVKGKAEKQRFDALVQLKNQLGEVNLDAVVDLSQKDTAVIVNSSFRDFDVAKLGLFAIKGAPKINTNIKGEIQSLDIDKLTGYAKILDFEYEVDDEYYKVDSLVLHIHQENPEKSIIIRSEILDFDAKGEFVLSTMAEDLQGVAKHFVPAVIEDDVYKKNLQSFDYELKIKEVEQLNQLLHPLFALSPNTQMKGNLKSNSNDLNLSVKADSLWVTGLKVNDLSVYSNVEKDTLKMIVKTENFVLNQSDSNEKFNFILDSLQMGFSLASNDIAYNIHWGDSDTLKIGVIDKGNINGLFKLNAIDSFVNKIHDMELGINEAVWRMNKNNLFTYRDDKFLFENITLQNQIQKIAVDGVVASNSKDELELNIAGVDAAAFNHVLSDYSTQLNGEINGEVRFKDLMNIPKIDGFITINDLVINDEKLGKLSVNSTWNSDKEQLNIESKIIYTGNKGSSELLNISGNYYPSVSKDKDALDFKANFSNLTVKVLQPFVAGNISEMSGWMSGNIDVTGSSDNILTNGEVKFVRGGLKVDFIGTKYYFSDLIKIVPNAILIDDFSVFDELGNEAFVNGEITHKNFNDIMLDIRMRYKKFGALDIGEEDNSLFYGKAFADGDLIIKGTPDDIYMTIQASPTENTKVVIPISSSYSVIDNDFITFINPNDTLNGLQADKNKKPEEIMLESGFNLDLQLDLNPKAEASIILPFQMGRIDGKGSGDIRMEVTSTGQFKMFGKYFIDEGNFDLNVQNILQNTFRISRGSYISWAGNPYDADINVKAVYLAKPSLKNLPAAQALSPEAASERIPVECIVNLSDKLFNPTIDFSINIPNADAKLREMVYSSIDTTNVAEMNKQMIYLLLLNSFHVSGYQTAGVGWGSQSLGLLSGQLSSWLSQVSDDFDIGINYRLQEETTAEEIEVALSTKLFNDRVLISGNFGVISGQETAVNNANTIVGDVLVEVKITNDGRFRVKGFNRTNNINLLEEESPYTQGVGIFYRKEFDYFAELFRRKRKKDLQKE